MTDIAAILLAAGRSRRMRAFKPLLPFGDETVIRTCIANLKKAGLEEIVAVVGHRADDLRKHLPESSVSFAVNPDPDSEMSASIARGVEQVSNDAKAVVIALVDHPAVSSETIQAVIEQWRRGALLVQPQHNGRGGHPVLVDLAYREELLNLKPETGLRSVFENHRAEVRRLTVDSPYVARDMDTWEDYVRLHTEVLGEPPDVNLSQFS